MKPDVRNLGIALSAANAITAAITLLLALSGAHSATMNALATDGGRVFVAMQGIADAGLGVLGLALGAGIALGLAGLGASLGMGTASAAALGAITEKPETFGKSILYVVFIEAVAIYGFVIAFLLIGYIPSVLGG
jgi:V/A-type H+-transporting ATPase subunit K